jgi:G3E family GTPase
MVTLVDAVNLSKDYDSKDFLRDRGEDRGEGDQRTLVDLLVSQMEFADVILLNKIDAATPQQLAAARKVIRSLNPDADLIETSMSRVTLDRVLDTRLFDHQKAQQHPLWYKELHGFATHTPESEEYGVRSFVYREKRPFDPAKFHRFLNSTWPGVIRAKGHFWLATRPDWVGELSQAGALVRHQPLGFWWTAVPKERWPKDTELVRRIAELWDPVYGDRRQEIVFIGTHMNESAIRSRLNDCLVAEPNGKADDQSEGLKLADPFPAWRWQ